MFFTVIRIYATGCLIVAFVMMLAESPSHWQAKDVGIAAFATSVFSACLLAMWMRGDGDSWLALYFRRKKAEERVRIKELERKSDGDTSADLPVVGRK
jgi:hypothetical protein